MAASKGTIEGRLLIECAGKQYEIGTIQLDVKVTGRKVVTPTTREIKAAIRKAVH